MAVEKQNSTVLLNIQDVQIRNMQKDNDKQGKDDSYKRNREDKQRLAGGYSVTGTTAIGAQALKEAKIID